MVLFVVEATAARRDKGMVVEEREDRIAVEAKVLDKRPNI